MAVQTARAVSSPNAIRRCLHALQKEAAETGHPFAAHLIGVAAEALRQEAAGHGLFGPGREAGASADPHSGRPPIRGADGSNVIPITSDRR